MFTQNPDPATNFLLQTATIDSSDKRVDGQHPMGQKLQISQSHAWKSTNHRTKLAHLSGHVFSPCWLRVGQLYIPQQAYMHNMQHILEKLNK